MKQRPKCCVPGCGRDAQFVTSLAKFKFRRSTWAAEEFGIPSAEAFVCTKHHSINYGLGGWHYKIFRKEYCENVDGRLGFRCTTTIVDPEWQLDADHIDGNPSNNTAENIQTLCKCCHAIKTRDEKDYMTAGRKTLGC